MNIYKFLGIYNEEPLFKGNPFKRFKNKTELNEYLLKNKIISKEQFFIRENPELAQGKVINEVEASTPF